MARGLAEEHGDEKADIASQRVARMRPDDRLDEAIHGPVMELDCFVALLLAMTVAPSR
jgi:hypothetical protein